MSFVSRIETIVRGPDEQREEWEELLQLGYPWKLFVLGMMEAGQFRVAVKKGGVYRNKLSPWAHYVTRPKDSLVYHQPFYNPPQSEIYRFKFPKPGQPESLRIYEAHVGISSWEGKINTYRDFAEHIIPRIHNQGFFEFISLVENLFFQLIVSFMFVMSITKK
uniref:Uncharacterized protein n=1 Tax=Parascaris equorum TaxID=6256 RepID=A0A914RPG8_PAREQ